jgi:hypothetical protein
MPNGLGDLHPKFTDPLETYFDVIRQGVALPRRRWIVKPEWEPRAIPGAETIQKIIDDHVVPRFWQLLEDIWIKFQCGTYFIKNPNWIEPPITARCMDVRTETSVALGATDTTILEFIVPDRFVGSLLGFGHALENPAQFGSVVWNIKVNGEPIACYQDFRQQIGDFVRPTLFPNPHRLKHQDKLQVTGRFAGPGAANAFARLYGFIFPAKIVTQDGSFTDYHTL